MSAIRWDMQLNRAVIPRMKIGRIGPLTSVVVCAVLFMSGCQALQFYPQAVWGQIQLLHQRTPVNRLLARPGLATRTRARLEVSAEILGYARQMGLESDGRYASYVELERRFVVWNVFVAPRYSLQPEQWCYPFVGCAPYRGFFAQRAAEKFAARYRNRGFETHVGGVPAYSTLGWFADPLLSTFIHWNDGALASLLMHELAHSRVWVKGDIAFNESFASFVGERGAQSWLQDSGRDSQQWLQGRRTWQRMRDFLSMARLSIEAVYTEVAAAPEEVKAARKARVYATVRQCYRANRALLGQARYDSLIEALDNAYLVSLAVYDNYVPAFAALFARAQTWQAFFDSVQVIADLEPTARKARLAALSAEQRVRTERNDNRADEINCETFARHSFHREQTG